MNNTFEDRILGVVREELEHRVGDTSTTDLGVVRRSAPDRRRTTSLAIAASVVVMAGAIGVVLNGDPQPVSVDALSDPTEAAVESPMPAAYSLGAPVGTYYRLEGAPELDTDAPPAQAFARTASGLEYATLQRSGRPPVEGENFVQAAGVVRGTQVFTVRPDSISTGYFPVFWFTEVDGTTTVLTPTGPPAAELSPEMLDLVEGLTFVNGRYEAGPGWTERFPLGIASERSEILFDDQLEVRTFFDSRWSVGEEVGEPVTVRDKAGVFDGGSLIWRERPGVVISLSRAMNERVEFGASGIPTVGQPATLDELLAAADGLVEFDAADLNQLQSTHTPFVDVLLPTSPQSESD